MSRVTKSHVCWLLVDNVNDGVDNLPPRVLAWLLGSQKKLFDIELPAHFTPSADLVLPVATPHGIGLLTCTHSGRVLLWSSGMQDALLSMQVALDAPDDQPLALVAVEGVGPVLFSQMGQMYVISTYPRLSCQRVWRPSESGLLSGIGRRVSNLFGFSRGEEQDGAAATSFVAVRAHESELWALSLRDVQVWQRGVGDMLSLMKTVSILDEAGTATLPNLGTVPVSLLDILPLGCDRLWRESEEN